MAKRGIPEVTQRKKPDVNLPSNIGRSKPVINQSNIPQSITSRRDKIKELSAPSRTRSIGNIEASTTIPKTTHREFFSKNNSTASRQRPNVESVTGNISRSRPVVNEIGSTNRNSIDQSSNIESPEIQDSVGSIRSFPPRKILRFSDL